MGNSQIKGKAEETFDLGRLVPFGVYQSAVQDYDVKLVKRWITERRIAPFYKGLNDLSDLEALAISPLSHPLRLKSHSHDSGSSCSFNKGLNYPPKPRTLRIGSPKKDRDATMDQIQALYKTSLECPICFLLYPRNINYSSCCDEPICTECLIQIKSNEGMTGPPSCPYCAHDNFSVVYSQFENPIFANGLESMSLEQKPTLHKKASPVMIDALRPEHTRPSLTLDSRRSPAQASTARFLSLRPPRRNRNASTSTNNEYGEYLMAMQSMGVDLEELMMMEAIRVSLQEAEERERNASEAAETPESQETASVLADSPIVPTSPLSVQEPILSATSTLRSSSGAQDELSSRPDDKTPQCTDVITQPEPTSI